MGESSVPKEGLSRLVILTGLLMVALNLRPAITSIGPVIETIRADLALSYAMVSLLTVIPVFFMGLFALGTPWVVRLLDREHAIFWGLMLLTVATGARVLGDYWVVMVLSTIVVGVGLAICQTILPSIVNTYFADRVAFATGLYTASLTIGAALGSGLTAPIQSMLGLWTFALAAWAIIGVIGLISWWPILRDATKHDLNADEPEGGSLFAIPIRNFLAWRMTLFLGMTGSFFFIVITWLPARYVAIGWSEASGGLLLTVYILTGLIGMLSISAFGDRTDDRRPWIVVMLLCLFVGAILTAFVPLWRPWITATIFGTGQGGIFTLALMLPADFSVDERATDQVSSMVFAGGFMAAAVGPYVIGGLLDLGVTYETIFLGIAIGAILIGILSVPLSPARDRVAVSE